MFLGRPCKAIAIAQLKASDQNCLVSVSDKVGYRVVYSLQAADLEPLNDVMSAQVMLTQLTDDGGADLDYLSETLINLLGV